MIVRIVTLVLVSHMLISCRLFQLGISDEDRNMVLPFIKNSPNECYFLDEFMPVPDSLVSGKSGGLKLRYYTYNKASYKDWIDMHVVLSFYSKDSDCWSLYEEYFMAD